jgi:hypothetical protein
MNQSLPSQLYLYLHLSIVAGLCGTVYPAFALAERSSMPSDPPKVAQATRSEPLPLPRDPDVAVQEEFDAARARATAEAWELFLARHGDHRLAAEARKELEKLRQKRGG